MIIVLQDRKTIVNFENVATMYTGESHKGEPHIYVETCDCECTPIGKYDTDRAKEVLREIVDNYAGFIASATNYRYGTAEVTRSYAIYRMPEV